MHYVVGILIFQSNKVENFVHTIEYACMVQADMMNGYLHRINIYVRKENQITIYLVSYTSKRAHCSTQLHEKNEAKLRNLNQPFPESLVHCPALYKYNE